MTLALALALATLAASAPGNEEVYYTITLTQGRVSDGKSNQLQVESWQWGAGVSKVDSFTVKQGVKPVASTGGVRVAAGDINDSSSVGGSEKITVDGGRTESGQATGKRQHLPIRARTYYDQALPSGSLRVKVKLPWLACKVGARYPSLKLSDGANSQVLQDVTVSSCSAGPGDEGPEESITFVYGKLGMKTGKVIVRGWDPEKKEE